MMASSLSYLPTPPLGQDMTQGQLANVVHLLAERYDTKSNVKLSGFQSQLLASCVSSHTEELWYNETVCLWMTI